MAKTHDDFLYTGTGRAIGKEQIYALLVDADRNPVLDASGNEQLVDLEVVEGRLQVDSSIVGSLAKGSETLSVPTTAGGTAFANIPTGATKAVITNEGYQVRYWVDGTAPTSSAGHLVEEVSDIIKLDSAEQLENFKAIGIGGTATLQITYF